MVTTASQVTTATASHSHAALTAVVLQLLSVSAAREWLAGCASCGGCWLTGRGDTEGCLSTVVVAAC